MFSHAAYKSYPAALLDRKRYDLLTQWLDKLTKHDLSQVDVSGCTDIDSGSTRSTSRRRSRSSPPSGTTGTLSIIPKDRAGAEINMRSWQVMYFQTFGVEPTPEDLEPEVDVIWPNFATGKLGHLRMADMFRRHFTGGDPSRFHALYGDAVSTDLMFLASKLRAAASRASSTASRSTRRCSPARTSSSRCRPACPTTWRGSSRRSCASWPASGSSSWARTTSCTSWPPRAWPAASRPCSPPDSAVAERRRREGHRAARPTGRSQCCEFFGVDRPAAWATACPRSRRCHMMCESGRYHVQPWVIPFVLRPRHQRAATRAKACRSGRAAFYDPAATATGAGSCRATRSSSATSRCSCGRTHRPHRARHRALQREAGRHDRITCAATQQLQHEAIDFLKGIDS